MKPASGQWFHGHPATTTYLAAVATLVLVLKLLTVFHVL